MSFKGPATYSLTFLRLSYSLWTVKLKFRPIQVLYGVFVKTTLLVEPVIPLGLFKMTLRIESTTTADF